MAAPLLPIEPPVFTGVEPYGIFAAATVIENAAGAILGGVQYAYRCDPATDTWPGPCPDNEPPPPGALKTLPANGQDIIMARPFAVYAFETCPLVGYTEPELEALARDSLRRGEQHEVERAMWLGRGDHEGFAQRDDVTVLSDTAVTPVEALALAEYWMGLQDGLGVFHVNPIAATPSRFGGGVRLDGAVYRSTMGHAMSFGGGYPLTGPDGEAPPTGAAWMYITRGVTIYRSSISVQSGLRPQSNEHDSRAERMYIPVVPCPIAAVPVQVLCGTNTVPELPAPEVTA